MKGRRAKPLTRGPANPDAQLKGVGRALLLWIADREDSVRASGNREEIKELQKGVPWEPERFYRESGLRKPRHFTQSIAGVLKRLEWSPKKKGKQRHLVQAWDTTKGTGKRRHTSHVKLTPAGRDVAEYEREHGKTPRQVNEAFWREVKRRDELQRLRARKEEMLDDLIELKSAMYEDGSYNDEVIREDEADITDVLERIVTLALLLDEPLTEDERSSVSLETPYRPLIKMPLAS